MKISELEDELDRIGLEFAIHGIGKLSYHCIPFILTNKNSRLWDKEPGFYLYIDLMNSPEELVDFDDYQYDYFIEIIKISNGFELKGEDIDIIKKQQGEAFSNYIEEKFEKSKLRLLFLYPHVEAFIK